MQLFSTERFGLRGRKGLTCLKHVWHFSPTEDQKVQKFLKWSQEIQRSRSPTQNP